MTFVIPIIYKLFFIVIQCHLFIFLFFEDVAEEECYKLAAELSQTVTRATDVYVQVRNQ